MEHKIKLFPYDRERMRPFLERFEAMDMMLREDSDEEMESLREACGRATPTNCYWKLYEVARWLETQIGKQLAQRRALRKRSADSASTVISEKT